MQQLDLIPADIRVHRVNPDANMRRFYRMHIQNDLFGGAVLIREWGRMGTAGAQRCDHFSDAGAATNALLDLLRAKRKRGYQ